MVTQAHDRLTVQKCERLFDEIFQRITTHVSQENRCAGRGPDDLPSLPRNPNAERFSIIDTPQRLYDAAAMSETLTIRVPAGEKARWEKAAAAVQETVAEYVRKAVRQRAQTGETSPWEKHLGSAEATVPPPTNANVRRSFVSRSPRKR